MKKIFTRIKRDYNNVAQALNETFGRRMSKAFTVTWYVAFLPLTLILLPLVILVDIYHKRQIRRLINHKFED